MEQQHRKLMTDILKAQPAICTGMLDADPVEDESAPGAEERPVSSMAGRVRAWAAKCQVPLALPETAAADASIDAGMVRCWLAGVDQTTCLQEAPSEAPSQQQTAAAHEAAAAPSAGDAVANAAVPDGSAPSSSPASGPLHAPTGQTDA
jgi:hypothetical protein